MKKIQAKGFMRWLLAAAMLVTALSGCSNTNNEGATPSASAPEPSESAPGQTLEEVTLKIYFVGSEPPQTKEVWANVEQMSKSELNAKFDINFIPWADYQDKMKLLAASGDDFDLYFDANWFIFPTMLKNDAQGRDHIRASATLIENGLKYRFEAEEGVLRAIGKAAMLAQQKAQMEAMQAP